MNPAKPNQVKSLKGLSGSINLFSSEKNLAVIVHSLFSAWMLSLVFEGQIFYLLSEKYSIDPTAMVLSSVATVFMGLLISGFFINTKKAAKKAFLFSYPVLIIITIPFFFSPTIFWRLGIFIGSFIAGICVATWGYYLKSSTLKNERINTIADMLILSNILMIFLNMTSLYLSPNIGLVLSMMMLLLAFVLAFRLPSIQDDLLKDSAKRTGDVINIAPTLAFLCFFILVITINSGLMYEVINPAFSHLIWLTSWYWAIPYIIAIFVMRNLPQRFNKSYLLYVAIAMIGTSFISFMYLEHSVTGYLIVNTLMLGACGIYDLFWWSILGEMLEFYDNPAKIMGIGLSANVLGVLLGGVLGNIIFDAHRVNSTFLALFVICLTLVLLPPLHKHLYSLLKDHTYLKAFIEISGGNRNAKINYEEEFKILSERESQVASRLLQGKTYKTIAEELFISENTVKYFVKNIYSKFNIQSRGELIRIILGESDN